MGRPYLDDKVNHRPFLQAALDYIRELAESAGGGGPHTHEQADINGLEASLLAKEDTGVAAATVAAHEGAADPHPTYLNLVEGDALYEALGAVAAHEAALDPHPVYLRQSEADALYEELGAVAAHALLADPHPGYLTPAEADALYEELGALAAHEAAADPHTGYQKESEKNNANGYPGLSAGGLLAGAQVPYGSGANTACQGNDARLSDARAPLIASAADGDTIIRSGGAWVRLAKGAAGKVLKINPGGTLPEWLDDSTGGGGATDLVFAPTPTDVAINNVADVTIATKDVTGVLAGDQIIVEGEFIILNNSGVARNYIITIDFDGAFDIELTLPSLAASATLMHPVFFRAVCNVRSTSLAYATVMLDMQLAAGIAAGADTSAAATHLSAKGWGTSAGNLTGTLTTALFVRSANATVTQTLRLVSFTIRKVSPLA